MLNDNQIQARINAGNIVIRPYNIDDLQPASIDLHLSTKFRVFTDNKYSVIDPAKNQPGLTVLLNFKPNEPFILQPGQFCLGSTVEYVEIPTDIVAKLEGKSSLGRLGLLIHCTAGFVDPGFRGTLTLELSNISPLPIYLWPNMKVAQICFTELSSHVTRAYGDFQLKSKYQGQSEPTASRSFSDF
jgi:dCTP deaminase